MQEQALNPSPAIVIETPAPNPSADNTARLKRIHHLMWATSLGVALTLPAAIAVPIWPKLAPISTIVLILTAIGLYLIGSWVNRAIQIPDANGRFPRWWERQRAKTTRPHIKRAIDMAGLMYFYGAMLVVSQWWLFTKDWDSLKFGIGFVACGIVIYIVFALLWGRAGSKIDRLMNPTIGQVVVVGITIAFFALVFFVLPYQFGGLKIGPAAPWSEQWTLVQQAVANSHPQAALTGMSVYPEYDAGASCDASLHTFFSFTESDNTDIAVTLRDSSPEASLQLSTVQVSYESNPYSIDDMAALKALYSTLLIGPRDAFLKAKTALEHDKPGANACGMRNISLSLQDPNRDRGDPFDKLGRPSVWYVSLFDTGPDHEGVQYWIDAQTGDVLLSENK